MSAFYILIGLILNLLFGFLFKPFFSVFMNITVKASVRCDTKTENYSSRIRKGAFVTLFLGIIVFFGFEILSTFIVNSDYDIIPRVMFILCGFFFSKAGQLLGVLKRIRKGIAQNADGYVVRCLGDLLSQGREKAVSSNYYNVLSTSVTKICAEFIITPAIIGLLFPAKFVLPTLATYLIISSRSAYANHSDVLTQGYFVFSQKLTFILSYPAYCILHLLILVYKWVIGIKFEKSSLKTLQKRCSDNLRRMVYTYENNDKTGMPLSARQINVMRRFIVFALLMSIVFILAVYIFVISIYASVTL